MVGEKRLAKVVITLISAAFQVIALLIFVHRWRTTSLPDEWLADFAIFISMSLALTLSAPMVRKPVVMAIMILLRVPIYLFISYPLGELVSIRFLLFTSILMDIGINLRPSIGILSILLMPAVFLLNQKPVRAFGSLIPQPPLSDSLAMLFVSLTVAALVVILRTVADRLSEERRTNSQLNSSVLQLTSANSEFLQYASVVERESVSRERNRITRDLHDIIGQSLTNIIMMMDAALHRSDAEPQEVSRLYQWTRDQAQSCLEETRAALYELRSIRYDQIRGVRGIKRLVDTFSSLTSVKISVEWGNLPWEFDDVTDQVVYRVIQESLSNSFRHGMATRVEIHFFVNGGVLNLSIRDNGKGGHDAKKGIGQTGMEERVRKLDGDISFGREATGYLVSARIPLPEEALIEAR